MIRHLSFMLPVHVAKCCFRDWNKHSCAYSPFFNSSASTLLLKLYFSSVPVIVMYIVILCLTEVIYYYRPVLLCFVFFWDTQQPFEMVWVKAALLSSDLARLDLESQMQEP